MSEANADQNSSHHSEDARKLWVTAIEHMMENEKLKERIEFLERKIAVEAFPGWTVH